MNLLKNTTNSLFIAMPLRCPPLHAIDKNGNPCGFFVDLVNELATFLGRDLEIIDSQFEEPIPKLIEEKYHIVGIIPITSEREKIIDFSIPFGKVGMDVVISKNFLFNGIESLNAPHVRIVAYKSTLSETSTLSEISARKNFPLAEIILLPDFESCINKILQGKADLVLTNSLLGFYYMTKYKNQLDWHYMSLDPHFIAFGLNKSKNKDFLNSVNDFVNNYKTSGKMNILLEKYYGELQKELAKKDLKFGI